MFRWVLGGLMLAFAVLAWSGCLGGEDEPSDASGIGIEDLAPADSIGLAEMNLDPGDPANQAVLEALGEEETLSGLKGAVEGRVGRLAIGRIVADGATDLPDDLEGFAAFDETVAPWLGDMAGFFATGEPEPSVAVVAEVVDLQAAEASLDELFRPDSSSSVAGIEIVDAGDELAWGFPEDHVVIGDPDLVRDSLLVSAGSEPAAADADWFREGSELIDRDAATLFQVGDIQAALESGLFEVPGLPKEVSRSYDELVFPEGGGQSTTTIGASDGALRLDSTTSGWDLTSAESKQMLGELPAGSWLAVADAGMAAQFADALAIGFARGFRQEARTTGGNGDAVAAGFERRLGFDPLDALRVSLGPAVVFGAGEGDSVRYGVRAGLPQDESARLVEALSFFADLIPGVKTFTAGDEGAALFEFEGLPGSITVSPRDETLEIVGTLGEEGATDPGAKLADSGRLDESSERLGDGFESRGFLDVSSLLDVLEEFAPGDDDLEEARAAIGDAVFDVGVNTGGPEHVLRVQFARR